MLGSQFYLSPEFFASHLRGTQRFRSGGAVPPKCPELSILPSYVQRVPFYYLEIIRPYYFPSGFDDGIRLGHTHTNNPRGCDRVRFTERGAASGNASIHEGVPVYETKASGDKPIGKNGFTLGTQYGGNSNRTFTLPGITISDLLELWPRLVE